MPPDGSNFPRIGAIDASLLSVDRTLTKPLRISPSQSSYLAESKEAKEKRIEGTAKDFEALLLHQMLTAMWRSVPTYGETSLATSREEELYRDMLNEALSNSIAEHQGLGIADIIAKEMKKQDLK